MIIRRWVSFGGGEVEVDICAADILAVLAESPETVVLAQQGIYLVAQFLKAISDEMIADMSPEARLVIRDVLDTQRARYKDR